MYSDDIRNTGSHEYERIMSKEELKRDYYPFREGAMAKKEENAGTKKEIPLAVIRGRGKLQIWGELLHQTISRYIGFIGRSFSHCFKGRQKGPGTKR